MTRAAVGALLGAAVAAFVAFVARPFFDPPLVGVGFVTVNAYPKGWDYFVVMALVVASVVTLPHALLVSLVMDRRGQ